MAQKRYVPDSAQLVAACLAGTLRRHAGWHQLTEAQTAAAVAELHEITGSRDDAPALLPQEAGLAIGTAEHKGEEYQARAQVIADLCRLAGASEDLIPGWVEEGRRRAEGARLPPFSRLGRTPPPHR